jgi:predicted nucleotidyltransferase component of viral defense system
MRPTTGLAKSVQVRLVRHAKALGVDPNLVFTRFAVERFLYRLSRSPHAASFVLKGALLLLVWLGERIRPTRDADLLGFGDLSDGALKRIFEEVCEQEVEPDGMTYDTASIRVASIRPGDVYGGRRVTLRSRLGAARLRVQVDVGLGDAVEPEPDWIDYPSLLDLPRPRLRAYRPETLIAEKVHAMVELGTRNSRMRDSFDVYALAAREAFVGDRLVRALRSTFGRRRTPIPASLPVALTPSFSEESGKRAQWAGFLRKSRLTSFPHELGPVVGALAEFLGPVLLAAAGGGEFRALWRPGGPWAPARTDGRDPTA